jgi:hypothetical protein
MRNPNKKSRTAYCTGCGVIFPQMHLLINHRRTFRCGGRFLSPEEKQHLINLRLAREAVERELRAVARVLASS